MGIQDLGAIGEFISSLVVLITLGYLAVQVRHGKSLLEENRRLAQSQVFQTRVGFRMENHLRQAEPHFAGYMAAYCPLWEALGMNSPRILAFVEQYEGMTAPDDPAT